MITVVLIIAHALSSNPKFQPELIYLGTLLADVAIFQALTGVV
jgi:hypothetical protein